MPAHCPKCAAPLGEADLFCGECGASVQGASAVAAPPAPAHEAERPAPPEMPAPVPPAAGLSAKASPKSYRIPVILLAAAAVATAAFLLRPGEDAGPARPAPRPAAATPETGPPARPAAIPLAIPPAEPTPPTPVQSENTRIDAQAQQIRDSFRANGVSQIAPLQGTVASCAGCVPFQIYCTSKIGGPADLRGKRVRVNPKAREALELVERHGGSSRFLGLSELKSALQTGIVDCAIAGGSPAN